MNPITPSTLRILLVIDPRAVPATEESWLARINDRIGALRHELVLVVIDGAEGRDHLPEPDYIVERGGAEILRLPAAEPVAGWPAEQPPDTLAAIAHLADALLIAQSSVYLVLSPGVGGAFDRFDNVLVVGGERRDGGSWVADASDESFLDFFDRALTRSGHGPADVCREAFERAIESLRRSVTEKGFTAASLADNPLSLVDANYAAVWARDGVITGLWTLCLDDPDLLQAFENTLSILAWYQSPSGQIPSNVRLDPERPDYSGIGGIASVDSVLWFVIGVARYAFHTGSRPFAEKMLESVERAMTWLSAHDANNDGLIEIPESSDWMDIFPRSYNVLYDEVLWYQACLDTSVLLDALGRDGSGWRDHAGVVRERIIDLFWPTGAQLMELAGNSSGRFSMGEGYYLLSQVTPFDYGWRCDVYGNLLASLTGLLDDARKERLFTFLWGVGVNSPFPVTCLYPPILSGAEDWKDYFLVNFLNLPDHYHNGGIWPFIGGLWVRFLYDIGRVELAHRELIALAEANRVGLYGEWEFNEWLHGVTGRPMGKAHQAWSAASYIHAYMALHEGGEAASFVPLDPAALS